MFVDTVPKSPTAATITPRLRGSPWLTLVILLFANSLMQMDRNLPTLVAEPIKLEFGLSDGQLGIFVGLAFALPLGVAGLILAPLIDRVNRRWFIAGLVSIWSGLTLLTGMAWNYVSLVCARAGLGAAEAAGAPTALSLIGDNFSASRRATAISIFKVGGPLGSLAASGLVGYVAMAQGWRAAFFFAAIPGFIVAILMAWLLVEPGRGATESTTEGREPVPYRTALAFVLRDRVCSPFALGMFLFTFAGAALWGFAAPFLQRHHDLKLDQIGLFFGIGSALGMISPLLVGLAADRLMQQGSDRLAYFICLYAVFIGGSALLMVLAPSIPIALAGFLSWQFFMHAMSTPCYAVLIYVTPPGMRGTVLSLMIVATMSFGYGLGPLVAGFTSDQIDGPQALRHALLLVVGSASAVSVVMFWFAAAGLRRRNREMAKTDPRT